MTDDSIDRALDPYEFSPGIVIAKRYEICERIGSGGMGLVFRAIDRELNDEIVALKLLHSHLAQDESVFRRFRNEVLVARSLSHPNIVRTHDIGRAERGFSYISMEYVDGVSLKDRLTRDESESDTLRGSAQAGSGVELDEIINILLQILSGVSYAHARGIIHRDLKPANVLMSKRGEVKLADFGTARIMGMDTSITRTGQVVGTPDYMSPEQIRGEKLDQSCDIYSLGIIAYELVSGTRPYIADSPVAVAFKHLNEPIPAFQVPESLVPAWYRQIVERATAKKKAERFTTVAEFAQAILDCMPQAAKGSGYFSVDGSHFLGTGRHNTAENSKTVSVESKSGKTSSKGSGNFELGSPSADHQPAWTLDYAADYSGEREEAGSDDAFGEGGPSVLRDHPFQALFGVVLILLTLAAGAIRFNPGLNAAVFEALKDEHGGVPNLLVSALGLKAASTQLVATQTEEPALPVEVSADPQREELQAELLGLSKTETIVPDTKTQAPDLIGTNEVTANAGVAAPVDREQVALANIKPEVQPEEKIVPTLAPSLEPAPVKVKEALSGELRVLRGSGELGQEAVSVDALGQLRWSAQVKGVKVPGEAIQKQELSKSVRLNIFDPRTTKIIARLSPAQVEPNSAEGSATVSGTFSALRSLEPAAGEYRADLVFDGEVVDAESFSVYLARVGVSQVSAAKDPNLVAGASSIALNQTQDPAPPAPPTDRESVTNNQGSFPPPGLPSSGGPTVKEFPPAPPISIANSGFANTTSPAGDLSGLPPAKGSVSNQGVYTPPTADQQDNFPTQNGAGVRERYSGNISMAEFPGGREEPRGLNLELQVNGEQVSGTGSITGFQTFSVTGKVLPRGIDLQLQNSEFSLRFTGGRRARQYKGTFSFPARQVRGGWQVNRID